jgi:tetratricopeptide (TPR) repeat protein
VPASAKGEWPDDYGRAGALSTLGELAARDGNTSEAIEDLQRSLALYQKLDSGTTSYDYYVADVYASLGRVFTSAGDNVKALALLNNALIISRTLKNREQEAVFSTASVLYMEQEDYAQARASLMRTIIEFAE